MLSFLRVIIIVLIFPKKAAEVVNKLDACVSDAEFVKILLEC